MPDHTFAITHLVGTSPDGIDAAIRNGIAKASQTLRNLEWFEVTEIRGYSVEPPRCELQVTLKLGFRYDDERPRYLPARLPRTLRRAGVNGTTPRHPRQTDTQAQQRSQTSRTPEDGACPTAADLARRDAWRTLAQTDPARRQSCPGPQSARSTSRHGDAGRRTRGRHLDLRADARLGRRVRHPRPRQSRRHRRWSRVPRLLHGTRRRHAQAPHRCRHPQSHRQADGDNVVVHLEQRLS